MKKEDFKKLRKILNKTQREMAVLLGISKKTIESYEQGLRNIPPNVQRIVYFLVFKLNMTKSGKKKVCWQANKCSQEIRSNCVAWLAKEGYFCWFITGKVCAGEELRAESCCDSCFECDFFKTNLKEVLSPEQQKELGL
jgi:transcriptional regulator with XRE-family HTH domain